jgi:hypothetical protein
MSDERRAEDRSPSFRSVELISTDHGGNESSFPVILRDSGGAGLGAVYIGQEPLDPEGEFALRDSNGGDRGIRIVWAKRIAEYVQMLGLVIAEG